MNFGVPNLRVKKNVEKYTEIGVLTLEPTAEGKNRRMVLNKKALELLNIHESLPKVDDKIVNHKVGFSFDEFNNIMIANLDNQDIPAAIEVGSSTNALSHKKTYEHIKKLLSFDDEKEVELMFVITDKSFNDVPVFKLDVLVENSNSEGGNNVPETTHGGIVDLSSVEGAYSMEEVEENISESDVVEDMTQTQEEVPTGETQIPEIPSENNDDIANANPFL